MIRPRLLAGAMAASAVLVLALVGCTPGKTQVSPDDLTGQASHEGTEPTPTTVTDVYDQEPQWQACGELECATLQVPVDWSEPEGNTATIAINRHLATGTDRLGSLLINPGGPGGSGLTFTQAFTMTAGEDLLASYDVIGFDPRGVGASTPLQCGTDEQIDEQYIPDTPIETQADLEAANAKVLAFAQNCRVESGQIAENVDTVSAARDMDVIRAAVGDDELYYLGFSYGTQLGATYAQLYPENVGRMVLDGAVDFLLPSIDTARGQAKGFENSLTNYLRWCGTTEECPLTGDVAAQKEQLSDLMTQAREDPFPTGADWSLNGNLFVLGVVVTLYDQASWSYLSMALEELVDQQTGAVMYELANLYLSRDSATGEYTDNSTWAFTMIGCLDEPPSDPWTIDDALDFSADMEQASPTFGWWFGSGTGCGEWPWTANEYITDLEQAATVSDQVLIVGTTNDPATPLEWSQLLADRMGANLLTYDGEGHTAYGRSNQCVIDAVDGFLVDDVMPSAGAQC